MATIGRTRNPSYSGDILIEVDRTPSERQPLLRQRSDYGATRLSNGSGQNAQHCHVPGQAAAGMDTTARRKLLIASALCLFFMIAEIVGGVLANSLAIATDAAHLLTDFASFMISLFAIYIAGRPATKRMSFGWYRAEVMGALVSVLLIWVVTGVLVYMAIQRCISMDFEIDATIMLITASLGVAVNFIIGINLFTGGSHGHSHGLGGHDHEEANHSHSHSHEKKSATEPSHVTTHLSDDDGNVPTYQEVNSSSPEGADGQATSESKILVESEKKKKVPTATLR